MVLAQLCPKKGCGAHLRLNEAVLSHGDDVRCPGSHEALKYCGHCIKVCARNSWHRHGGEHTARKGGRPRKETSKSQFSSSGSVKSVRSTKSTTRVVKSEPSKRSKVGQMVDTRVPDMRDTREDMRAPDDEGDVRALGPKGTASPSRGQGPLRTVSADMEVSFEAPSYNAPKATGFGMPAATIATGPGHAGMGMDTGFHKMEPFGDDLFAAHRPSVEDLPLDFLDGAPRQQSFSKVDADLLFSDEWDLAPRDSSLSMGSLSEFPPFDGRRISDVGSFEGMEGMEGMEMSMPSDLLDGADWADAPSF